MNDNGTPNDVTDNMYTAIEQTASKLGSTVTYRLALREDDAIGDDLLCPGTRSDTIF